jgi:hypothetical protein
MTAPAPAAAPRPLTPRPPPAVFEAAKALARMLEAQHARANADPESVR